MIDIGMIEDIEDGIIEDQGQVQDHCQGHVQGHVNVIGIKEVGTPGEISKRMKRKIKEVNDIEKRKAKRKKQRANVKKKAKTLTVKLKLKKMMTMKRKWKLRKPKSL